MRLHKGPRRPRFESNVCTTLPCRGGKGRPFAAEGSPGWGSGGASRDTNAGFVARLSPPPRPPARGDLPPTGGGRRRRPVHDSTPPSITSGARLQCGEFPIALKRHPGAGETGLFNPGLGVVAHAVREDLLELSKALRRRGDLVVRHVDRLERAFEHVIGRRRACRKACIPGERKQLLAALLVDDFFYRPHQPP